MRLNAFFVKPASRPSQQPASEVTTAAETVVGQDGPSETSSTRVESTPTSDYIKEFPPFFVQSHVTVGPSHRFQRDADGLDHVRKKLDDIIKSEQTVESPKFNATELFSIRRYRRRQGRANGPTVREILASMQGSSTTPVDLTSDTGNTVRPEDMLKKIPVKILKYAEDVRPPYRGTFTKHIPDRDAVKLCRNPFARVISDFNYDYDSEAEWEEPEEGEDLDSDGGDDDPSEDDADDMDDFLDDTEDDVKRRNIVGSLEPICSGIRWADGLEVDPAFKPFRMEPLLGLFPVRNSQLCHLLIILFQTLSHSPSTLFLPATGNRRPAPNLLLNPQSAASWNHDSNSSFHPSYPAPRLPKPPVLSPALPVPAHPV